MSFWSTIGGLFTGDTYFPDNPNREARAKELARDCQNYAASLATLATSIREELKRLDQELAGCYGSPADMPPDARSSGVRFDGLTFEVPQFVAPLVVAPVVSGALEVAATSYLVSTGEIGAAALIDLVGLPAAFDLAIGAAAGVAAIGVTFGIGAIQGAVKRDRLRDTIHEGVSSRAKLAKAYLIDGQLESSVSAMLGALEALKAAGIPAAAIMEKLKPLAEAAREHVEQTTDATSAMMLAQLDASRSSWTSEDA